MIGSIGSNCLLYNYLCVLFRLNLVNLGRQPGGQSEQLRLRVAQRDHSGPVRQRICIYIYIYSYIYIYTYVCVYVYIYIIRYSCI